MNGEVRQWGVSRWCAGPDEAPIFSVTGHTLCAMRRWRNAQDALDLGQVNDGDLESWMCTCSCHPTPPPRVDCPVCGTGMIRLGSVDVPHTDQYHEAWRTLLMCRLARALYGSVAVRMGHRIRVVRVGGGVVVPACRCGWRGTPTGPADAAYEARTHLVDEGTDAAGAFNAAGSFIYRLNELVKAPGSSMAERDLAAAAILRTAATCQCCGFGNHSIRCTCDGSDCCHPDDYLMYNPAWGHGKGHAHGHAE